MSIDLIAQIFVFAVFSFIAVAGAVGMTTTMSMFRSGIFLMASFIGVAGLFILLMADLLGMLQIMMYIGGMLVMILFMVLFSGDPGGDMMAKMEMPLIEKFFSKGILPKKTGGNNNQSEHPHNHMHHNSEENNNGDEDGKDSEDNHDDMNMGMDMSMFTAVKKQAAVIGIVTGVLLIALILFFPDWPVKKQVPNQDSANRIGELLMGKYMMAFEGAGLMILLGIFGAIYLARPGKHPDSKERGGASAVNEKPLPASEEKFEPYFKINIDDLKEKAGDDK